MMRINIAEKNSGYGLAMRYQNREQLKERNFFVNAVKWEWSNHGESGIL